jgi:hypothetical protein
LSVEDSDEPKLTNADWTAIFDGLKHEITIRHYSPKTLRSYSSWACQLQPFTKSKDPCFFNLGRCQKVSGSSVFRENTL